MRQSLVLLAVIFLAAAGTAQAQSEGGHRGPPGYTPPPQRARPPKPLSDSDIVGVVKQIDPASGRVTIAYEPVEARNWPAGIMPFTVYKNDVLQGVTVGEKVRFKLDGQQITELQPY
jgi:Cu(I)/Ag(I) efflux system protein CusF